MKKNEVVFTGKIALENCLKQVPFVRELRLREDIRLGQGPDFALEVSTDSGTRIMLVEARSSGEPRLAREAVQKLQECMKLLKNSYPLFLAPFITRRSSDICRNAGVGFLDLAGNCWIATENFFINNQGKENPYKSKRRLQTLYKPKASSVLRVLLEYPGRRWKIKDLSREAGASLGTVHNVKSILLDREWLDSSSKEIRLNSPGQLLQEWSRYYRFSSNLKYPYFTDRTVLEVESELAKICFYKGYKYAFTEYSAAVRLVPVSRHNRICAYLQNIKEVEEIAEILKLDKAQESANIFLMVPFDPGLFYASRKVMHTPGMLPWLDPVTGEKDADQSQYGESWVVSPVQAYLDLLNFSEQGKNAAQELYRQMIQPRWAKG